MRKLYEMEISAVFSELVSMLVINNLKFALQLFYVLNVYSIAFAALRRMREKRLHMGIIFNFFLNFSNRHNSESNNEVALCSRLLICGLEIRCTQCLSSCLLNFRAKSLNIRYNKRSVKFKEVYE